MDFRERLVGTSETMTFKSFFDKRRDVLTVFATHASTLTANAVFDTENTDFDSDKISNLRPV